ncbi:cell division protein FtsK, partial [Candidatus Frankia alpina]|uniref:cell division protein FtsK n=1 Tax=Candidatus Frankia alpina TaxID=2699483 RepID=UPI0013D7F4E9
MSEQPASPSEETDGPDATVLPGPWLPAIDDDRVIDGEVIDAAGVAPVGLVDDGPRTAGGALKRRRPGPLVRADTVRGVTRPAARAAVHVGYGHVLWARRAVDAATHAAIREQIRATRARGDAGELKVWLDQLQAAKNARRARLANLPEVLKATVITAASGVLVIAAGLVALGILVGVVTPLGIGWGDYWHFLGWLLGTLVTWATILVPLAAAGLVPAWLVAAWRTGRAAPGWVATSTDDNVDIVVDERTLTQALAALRIRQITDYLKIAPMQYLVSARQVGRGTHAVVRLPAGLPASHITAQTRRESIAASLHRRVNEVWLRTGDDAGLLDIWIADPGALQEGAGPYPLLTDGKVDVFKGVPFGKSLRGEPLTMQIRGRNSITAGMPDQGKSSVARTVMTGVALDPTAELRIWVPDSNYDFEAFAPRCSRYVMGAENEKIEQICLDMEELVDEIQTRGEKLIEHGETEVTRKLASAGVGLHPIGALLEEAHIAFAHPVYGERIIIACETVVRLGRKRLIHLILSTQATTGNSVPPAVTMNCANGICFAVARWQENDAVLGQGAYAAGHRATDLIPGVDKGNAVVRGLTQDRSVVAQAYFLSASRGNDQVTPIITRSLDALRRKGLPVPGTTTPRRDTTTPTTRDLLEDLDEVLGTD